MDQWAHEDVEAHGVAQARQQLLQENGEFVGAQALTPEQTWVRDGGPGRGADRHKTARCQSAHLVRQAARAPAGDRARF
jgi:hypothetical protein